VRDWRIYADFAQSLIGIARPLYAQESFGVDLQETVYALDTTICVCRYFRGRRSARPRQPSSCIRCSICAATSLMVKKVVRRAEVKVTVMVSGFRRVPTVPANDRT
jgi:hypothetical protein